MKEKQIIERIKGQHFGRQYITPIVTDAVVGTRRQRGKDDTVVEGSPSRHSAQVGTGIAESVEQFHHPEAGPALKWTIRPPATPEETASCYRQMLTRWVQAYDDATFTGPDDHREMERYRREQAELQDIADEIRGIF